MRQCHTLPILICRNSQSIGHCLRVKILWTVLQSGRNMQLHNDSCFVTLDCWTVLLVQGWSTRPRECASVHQMCKRSWTDLWRTWLPWGCNCSRGHFIKWQGRGGTHISHAVCWSRNIVSESPWHVWPGVGIHGSHACTGADLRPGAYCWRETLHN